MKHNPEVQVRPWGTFQCLLSQNNYLIRKIVLSPNQIIPFQSNDQREETFIVVKGQGILEVEREPMKEGNLSTKLPMKTGDVHSVQQKERHQIIASGLGFEFIEIQRGIVRVE